jgi:hypothetical protein
VERLLLLLLLLLQLAARRLAAWRLEVPLGRCRCQLP